MPPPSRRSSPALRSSRASVKDPCDLIASKLQRRGPSAVGLSKPSLTSEHCMSITMSLTVNGVKRTIAFDDPRVTLLDLLRERLYLTGTKKGCDRGQCGA